MIIRHCTEIVKKRYKKRLQTSIKFFLLRKDYSLLSQYKTMETVTKEVSL